MPCVDRWSLGLHTCVLLLVVTRTETQRTGKYVGYIVAIFFKCTGNLKPFEFLNARDLNIFVSEYYCIST